MITNTVWYVYKPASGHAGYTSIRPLAFFRAVEDAHIPL